MPPPLRRLLSATLAAGTVLLGGCASLDHGAHCIAEPGVLDEERQFVWAADGAVDLIDESGAVSPAIVELLKERVTLELASKGFERVDDPAQLVNVTVRIYLRTRRELISTGPQGGSVGPCAFPDCWHDNGRNFSIQTRGFLAADVYYLGRPIWRGWVERGLHPSQRDQARAVIEEAVPLLFAQFPP